MPASVQVGRSFRESLKLLRARPGTTIALGSAIVLGLLSVCCGIGMAMTPWLLCELLAIQLAEASGKPTPRGPSWVSAGLLMLGAVLFTVSVGWLTWLGLGTDADLLAAPAPTLAERLARGPGVPAAFSAWTALLLVLPFLYTPLILLDARASLGGAVLESARLVVLGGALRHYVLSFVENTVQLIPVLVAGFLAAVFAPEQSWPLLVLLGLPLLSVSVPIGHGMVVSTYAGFRGQIVDPERTRSTSRPPRALILVWLFIGLAPVLSFALLGAALVRPSRLPPGQVPATQVESIAVHTPLRGEVRVHPPGTALEIVVSPSRAEVVASDGGGAGVLPLHGAAPIETLRVVRKRDRYGIELSQASHSSITWIDAAGVRLDDDLRARLLDRVPRWVLWAMLAALFATACTLLPVLAALGEVRRRYALLEGPVTEELSQQRMRTVRRSFVAAALLFPLAVFTLYWGGRSLLA